MTLRDRERQQANPRAQHPPPRSPRPALSSPVSRRSDAQATPLKLRHRQRILLAPAQDDLLFAVQSGVVSARIAMASSDAGLITLYFPGDIIPAGAVPNFTERMLVAATAAEALRMKSKSMFRLLGTDPDLLAAYDRQRDRQAARASLHAAILATLDGPQRLAAFLIEMALEVGVAAGSTIAIELPLTRTEIAQHLALNADTLSRLMSRFKADGLITQKSRHQIALRNWRAIADMCPVTAGPPRDRAQPPVTADLTERPPAASPPRRPRRSRRRLSEMRSTETTFSSASVLKMRTPCVLRPAMRTSSHRQRISCPPSVTSMIWSESSTGNEATRLPLRSLTTMATMPLPPRPLVRYS